ncbi:hypothetical protein Tco_1560902 [Tanacetum coccineum]
MILESVENCPPIWPTVEENGVTRTKKYVELSAAEKIQADCDMKATNIILQGLPADIYSLEKECKLYDAFDKFTHIKGESLHNLPPEWSKFVTDVKLVKDLHTTNFDQLHAYLEQHELHANEVHLLRFAILVFSPGDDPIACLNKAMAFLTLVASLRVTVQQVQGRQGQHYSSIGYKSNATSSGGNNTSGQAKTEDLDTYDSDYDDISNAKAVLMANISNYGSDAISELRMSNPTSKPSDASPINIEAPKELPKVSLVNESLKKLKFHLARFDNVVKIRTTPDAHTEGEWGFEHTKAVFNNEIIPFLKSLKDIFNVFDKDLLNEIMEVQTVFDQMDVVVQQSLVDKQCLEIAKKELLLENDRLFNKSCLKMFLFNCDDSIHFMVNV